MKRLTCEMCGSTELLKQEGVFVCQTCGTKYSVEEAKKMMVEGTVEVAGTVKVDNTASIENYLKIARTAYSSKNHSEAENYANKVIEIAPDNWEAWLIKGKAAGWQSTLANPRFPECISNFTAAINNVPKDKKKDITQDISKEITNISCALIALRADRFVKWPDSEEANGFISDLATILQAVTGFLANGVSIPIGGIMSPVAEMINKSVINAYESTIYPDYKSNEYPYPNDRDFSKYIERIDYCIQLVEQSIKLCDDDSKSDIQRYKNLIDLQEYAINACSYDWEHSSVRLDSSNASWWKSKGYIVDIYHNRVYFVKSVLTDSAKSHRRSKISEYKSKISAIEAEIDRKIKAEKKKKRDEFWSKHSEEHKALTEELRKTKQKRDELTKAQKGYSKVKLLDKHIAKINAILEEDRNPTSQLEKAEKDFVKNCETFWNNLSSNDGYDEYLDNYPILKKVEEYSQRRSALIEKKVEIEKRKKERKNGIIAKILLVTFIAAFLACVILPAVVDALEDCALAFIFLAVAIFIGGIGLAVAGPFSFASADATAKKIRQMEDGYRQGLAHYNKTIDEMNAVPRYTGNVSHNAEVSIPLKIDEN